MEQGIDVAAPARQDWPTWPAWRGSPLEPSPLRAGRDHRAAFPLVVAARNRSTWADYVAAVQCDGDAFLRRHRDSNYPSHLYR